LAAIRKNELEYMAKNGRQVVSQTGKRFLEFVGATSISHDRWLLDRIAIPILALHGNSQVTFFDGNYQE
jgi:hypothetical protein